MASSLLKKTFPTPLYSNLLGVHPDSLSLTSVRNREDHEFISMDNVQSVLGLGEEARKQNHEGLRLKVDNIIQMWKDSSLTVWVEVEQNDVVNPRQVALLVRRVPKLVKDKKILI